MKRNIFFICLILIIGISLPFWYLSKSPQYSLYLATKSITNHDSREFKKYVDIETLFSGFLDDAMRRTIQDKPTKNGAEQFGSALAVGFMSMAKPGLIKTGVDNITRDIENPSKKFFEPPTLPLMLLSSSISLGPIKIQSIQKDGKVAKITLKLEHSALPDVKTASLTMREMDGHWQISGSDDYQKLGQFINAMDRAGVFTKTPGNS